MHPIENRTVQVLKNLGFNQLNNIQIDTLTSFEIENNIVLVAPTGSGKTLAFLLPILESLTEEKTNQALVIAPSRELAIQIEQVFKSMKTIFKVNCCYGGHTIKIELNNLIDAPQLIIGTPGRIADHIRRGSINSKSIQKSLQGRIRERENQVLSLG